jgi:eukaryotic-like serine/threonine-protein kinase
MSSLVGQSLGNYRVLARLGAGGMGEVFRARDDRLDRDVAIKVLHAAFAGHPERLKRFETEARALAALNDPNILAIYEIGTQDGCPYLVSELLEGETLRSRVLPNPLPFHRAIDYAMQIVRGLMAAHEKRLVHRDLKPENIFITSDGRVKILDFGLAKLALSDQTGTGSSSDGDATLLTSMGVILGTVGYMSPEQLRGQTIDCRSDIFSFGAILYEMLTGKRAFRGATQADTISAILKEDPENLWELIPNAPPATSHIVRHCLEKRPEDRFQTARDLLFDLSTLSSLSGTTSGRLRAETKTRAELRPRPNRRLWAALAGALVLAVLAAVFWLWKPREALLPSYHQVSFRRGTIWAARFTPDANTIVYSASWSGNPLDIWSARPGSTESRSLGLSDTDLLAVSSTGEIAVLLHRRELARFVSRGTLGRVPLAGGAAREVLEDVREVDWSPDGQNLAIVHDVGDQERLEFPIGKPLFETSGWVSGVRISPKGERIAFMEHSSRWDDRGWISVVDLTGHKRRLSSEFSSEQGLAWSPGGDEVWFTATKSGEAYALRSVTLGGKERVLARVPANLMLHDIAGDGTLLLSSYKHTTPVIALPPGQKTERDLSWLDEIGVFDLSGDGKTFLFQYYGEDSGPNYTSYLGKTDGSPAVRLGEGAAVSLSPDGKWALTILNTSRQVVLLPTGPGQSRILERKGMEAEGDDSFTPDGKQVVFTGRAPGQARRCFIQDISGGEPRALTPEGFTGSRLFTGSRVSPDGRLLLAQNREGKIVLFPMHGGEAREVQGLNSGEAVSHWSADGRWLYIYRLRRPFQIFQLDPLSGRRQLLRTIEPSDSSGITGDLQAFVLAGGQSYLYSFQRHLSELYLVKNIVP